ncbi:MAG: DUF4178 domain-containing protein [Limisphaerales bacterium]
MSTANPTPVRVGMTGTFAGKPYTIIARVVMGMEDQGETYYWNEFYLSDSSDRIAMLVCEEVYGAQQWRLFTEFTPAQPLTAAEAAATRVGSRVSLDGVSAEVTVVDESRVYFIEGKAPDWLAVGDMSKYFNAEAGGKMWVVSWSGDEVEYYRGMQLHPEAVAQALRLPATSFKRPSGSGSSTGIGSRLNFGVISALLSFAVLGFFFARSCGSGSAARAKPSPPRVAVQRQPAPATPLAIGASVTLDGKMFRVVGHRLEECTKVNAQWNSHHYQVADGAGQTNQLILRGQPDWASWHLFKPWAPSRPPAPSLAAVMRVGEAVTLDSFQGRITELFMCRIATNNGAATDGFTNGGVVYHYLAMNNTNSLLASWNGERIVFHRGAPVTKHTP